MEELMSDIVSKVPALEELMRPEYLPYLKTAGTVLLGWIVVSWVVKVLVFLFAPVVVSLIAIVIICPATMQWCLKQLGPNVEVVITQFLEKLRSVSLGT